MARYGFLWTLVLLFLVLWLAPVRAQITAVGYLNIAVRPGLSLISCPLEVLDPRVGSVFASLDIPDGTVLFLPVSTNFLQARFDAGSRQWIPAEAAEYRLVPGGGFFISNPTGSEVILTFAGSVPQGLLTNAIPAGYSIISSIVPQAGTLDLLGFPAEPGDMVFRFDSGTQTYHTYFFDEFELQWHPEAPRLEVGEAMWVFKGRAMDWIREFSVIGSGSLVQSWK
jgi:hypothetical protein